MNERHQTNEQHSGAEKSASVKESGRAAVNEMAQASSDLRKTAQQAGGALKDDLTERAQSQKRSLMSLLSDMADAVGTAAKELEQRNHTSAAQYAQAMGSGLSSVSSTINEKSPEEMVADVTRLARRHPAAFVGGAVLVGLALARFAKASADNDGHEHGTASSSSTNGNTRSQMASSPYAAHGDALQPVRASQRSVSSEENRT